MNIKVYYVKNKGKEEKEDVPNECIFKIYNCNKLYNNMYSYSISLNTYICIHHTHTHNVVCVCVYV